MKKNYKFMYSEEKFIQVSAKVSIAQEELLHFFSMNNNTCKITGVNSVWYMCKLFGCQNSCIIRVV